MIAERRSILLGSVLWLLTVCFAVPAQGAPQPQAQVTAKVRPSDPAPLVTIGDGVNSRGRFNGASEQPFVSALAALPVGGSILVGQGAYSFSSPVTIAMSGITIQGSGATLLSSDDPNTGIFLVTGGDVRLQSLVLRDELPDSNHSLIDVRATGFRMRDCTFFAGDALAVTPMFTRVELSSSDLGGIWIQDNVFHPDRGWIVAEVDSARNVHITGNRIAGANDGSGLTGRMAYGFRCLNMKMSEIRGNTFNDLGTVADPVLAAIFSENEGIEGHHLVIADNVIHDFTGRRVMHLRGSRFNVVEGNSIGRIFGPELIAAIDVEDNSTGGASASTTIVGNDFHNVSGAPTLQLDGGSVCLVSSNLFSLVSGICIVVGGAGAADDVSILSNQFSASGGPLAEPAISIKAGDGHFVHGNVFRGFATPAVVVIDVPEPGYDVSGNFEP